MNKRKKQKNQAYTGLISKRLAYFGIAMFFLAGIAVPSLFPQQGKADLLATRSLRLSSSAKGDVSLDANGVDVCALTTFANPQGGCGAKAKHTVTFNLDSLGGTKSTGGIIIMYCTSPIFSDSCVAPTGMTATFLDTVTVSGLNGTSNFTIDNATSNATLNAITAVDDNGECLDDPVNSEAGDRLNCVVMKRGSAQVETGTPTATIAYGGTTTDFIRNPIPAGNENYTFYARILVFSDVGYTTLVDYGGLAASTAQQVDILAKVQEILRFSVGTSPTGKVSNAACTAFNDTGALTLGDANDVLDPNTAFDDFSYFRINTNTVNGAVIAYSGETLISGANDINEIGAAAASSTTGTEQFGLAFDDTHDPNGAGGGDGHEFTDLTAAATYANGDGTITTGGTAQFAFADTSRTAPITIATSTAGITCDTGAVRYLANISTSTPAGIYRTTITYIATGTY